MILLYLTAISLLMQGDPEVERLLRPTPVKLDYLDQPVADVVQSLAERCGIPLVVYPDEPTAGWRNRRISLTAPEPVPFWVAIDRLEPSAGLILDELHGGRESGSGRAGGHSARFWYDRVFRCRLASVDDEREWVFGNPLDRKHTGYQRAPGGGVAKDPGSRWERFSVRLEVMSEPRPMTSLVPAGPPRIIEAIDDQGHSLILPREANALEYPRKYYDKEWYAGFNAQLFLKTPDLSSRSLRMLKGTVPLVQFGRRAGALTVPLEGSEGRTFKGAGVTLKVLKRTNDAMTVELRSNAPPPPEDRHNLLFDTYPGLRVRSYDEQFEWLDTAGRSLPAAGRSSGYDPAVTRVTICVKPGGKGGPPDRLRFHELVRIETEVGFEFRDIPLP